MILIEIHIYKNFMFQNVLFLFRKEPKVEAVIIKDIQMSSLYLEMIILSESPSFCLSSSLVLLNLC